MSIPRTCFAGACAVALLIASNANAHLTLVSPSPRLPGSPGSALKNGPCGQPNGQNGRTETVTVFAPGETIEIVVNEDINHPAYYRVAFDDDGDDGFPIRANMDSVVRDGDDPAAENPVDGTTILGYIFEDTEASMYSTMVTLPNIQCENCTLQVIQFMYDKLGDGMNNEYYYQCADIALRGEVSAAGGASSTSSSTGDASTTGEQTTTSGVGGSSAVGAGGATSTSASVSTTAPAVGTTGAVATTGASVGGTSSTSAGPVGTSATTATSGVGGTGFVDPMSGQPANSEEGCGCRLVGAPSPGKLLLLPLGVGLAWTRRRRRSA